MPSVTKWTVEPGRGQPAGTWWVSTNAGPQAWFPPQPWATSKVRRPVSTAPSPEVRLRTCSALGPDILNVMGSDPPVWISTSPEVKYQSNTSATPSLRSATKPSSDMDMIATTFDIACSLQELWLRFRGSNDYCERAWMSADSRRQFERVPTI